MVQGARQGGYTAAVNLLVLCSVFPLLVVFALVILFNTLDSS